MKQELQQLLTIAIAKLQQQAILPTDLEFNIQVERAKDKEHGDYASNIAMTLTKAARIKPRELAEKIVSTIPATDFVKEISIAGPGFINFFLAAKTLYQIIPSIFQQKGDFGRATIGQNQKILLEFISANPTGPLHVGHGRSAAYGATLANILEFAGYKVHREYYVNDAGRQMNILAVSIWLRYLELFGKTLVFPSNGYKGDYVIDIAKSLKTKYAQTLVHDPIEIFANVPADASKDGTGDKEGHIDGLIENAQKILGKDYHLVFQLGLQTILEDIREDLRAFGVPFDQWFSEKSLHENNALSHAINKLREGGHLYDREGATWFSSIVFGDDKDRVVIRENGQTTYFASDLAYLLNKFERNYDQIIYIFGSDHHGYVARLTAAAKALGVDPKKLNILLVQFAILYRGGKKVQMSTRSGSFVTLRELREEVGNDAARFFYVMRKREQHIDFDLDLAKSQSNENPVYYIQYAHARICSVFRQLQEKQLSYSDAEGLENLDKLTNDHEKALLAVLTRYPEIIITAAQNFEPHLIANYLREIATDLHIYYNAHQFLVEEQQLRNARLCLIKAAQQVLVNGLHLLGLSAPEKM